MTIAAHDRVNLLRQAAAHGRRNPDDLFGARMAIHDALEGTGVDSNRVCDALLTKTPPISEWACERLDMVADQIEQAPDARSSLLFGLCEMARMLSPD
ncbi:MULTISPECIES: hypothetical protein [Pseudomonas]|jgi:hypothetical protein|uniref:Uncharacterized protein n=1 Tax=Pseudomonas shirazica TaxID=1940636 RepID=A0ABY9SKF5_9PSED|nr:MULTISPECIES: hypothetical protein [Pseudomonas]WMY83399.1 hypothetical protein QR297_15595 [Pseudomonas shirazica]